MINNGQQWFWGMNEDELDIDDALEQLDKKRNTVPDMHWKEAYELNKTRDKCILCGNDTIQKQTLRFVIQYCPCIEDKIE